MKIRQFKKACKRKYEYVYIVPKIEKYIMIIPDRKVYVCKHCGFNYEFNKFLKNMYFPNFTDFNKIGCSKVNKTK